LGTVKKRHFGAFFVADGLRETFAEKYGNCAAGIAAHLHICTPAPDLLFKRGVHGKLRPRHSEGSEAETA
jgi:hypothetical protein